ncbi:hypothetical protein VdG1_03218 [Verticillium dahliae VDG1]|nr:hypothetical protein VdG1_03218 [Verticillium dahliae VDG1]
MAGKPSYTRKQIEFVLIHILDKVALHRIIEAFKETFSQDVTIGQIKYLKSKYGKDPDYGSPLLEGRVRIVEEMATFNGIDQGDNTFEETTGYRSHEASTTDTDVDQQPSYNSDALELVHPTHDHAEARGVGEGWSFFDEAVAFTNSRTGSMGEHGNLDEADTLLAAAFTESEMAGTYMN